jgi:hypothetical protein
MLYPPVQFNATICICIYLYCDINRVEGKDRVAFMERIVVGDIKALEPVALFLAACNSIGPFK